MKKQSNNKTGDNANMVVERTGRADGKDLKHFLNSLTKQDIEVLKEEIGYKDQLHANIKEFENIRFIKKNKKCCIVGFAPSWCEAPYGRTDIDFWGINELYKYIDTLNPRPAFAAWFEIHNIKESPSKQNPAHQKFLKECSIPLITQKHWEDYPSSIAYPRLFVKEQINRHFVIDGKHEGYTDYSNQITWMIALAVMLGYEEIMVYGVDMAQESEYAFQRASCQFFLGYAAGRGIKISIPASCELIKAGADYGFKTDNKNRYRKKNKIQMCGQQLESINIRQGQILYGHKYIDEQLDQKMAVLEADIDAVKKNIHDIEIFEARNNRALELMKFMPFTGNKEVEDGRDEVIKNSNIDLEKLAKDKKVQQDLLKKYMEKKQRMLTDNDVNHTLLDKEYEANKVSHENLKGMIKEAQHDLNNNLV